MTIPDLDAPGGALEHSIAIAASAETVYALWTTSDGLASWWGTSAEVDPRPGGAVRVLLDGGPVMRGEFVELDPPRRVVFTFGWEVAPPEGEVLPGSTTVEVDIAPSESGVLLTLRHSGLPEAQRDGHRGGWAHFLGELAKVGAGA